MPRCQKFESLIVILVDNIERLNLPKVYLFLGWRSDGRVRQHFGSRHIIKVKMQWHSGAFLHHTRIRVYRWSKTPVTVEVEHCICMSVWRGGCLCYCLASCGKIDYPHALHHRACRGGSILVAYLTTRCSLAREMWQALQVTDNKMAEFGMESNSIKSLGATFWSLLLHIQADRL